MSLTALALEISEQKIRYVFLEKRGNGLAPQGTGVSTFKVDTSFSGALAKFIKETISAYPGKVSRIFLTINRRDTVIHQIALPKTSNANLKIVVPGEIEKIPNFTERNFDYVYSSFELDSIRNKIIFAAVSDDLLQYLRSEVEQTRLPCRELEIVPLNFIGLLASSEFTDSVQSLVIVNDYITYLIIFKNQKIKYLYSTNTGKEHLLPAYNQGKIDKLASSSWAEELKRVTKSYLLDNKQESINKSWVLWDEEGVAPLDEYLRTEAKVELQPIKAQQFPYLEKETLQGINPVYLLACVPAIYAFNKFPSQFSLTHFFRNLQTKKYIYQTLAAALVFMGIAGFILGGMSYRYYQTEQNARRSSEEVQQKIETLQKQSEELFKKRDQYLAVRNQLLAQATYVKILNRMSWSEVLSVVASELPEELSLKSFSVDESGLANFTGEAFRIESVAEMLRKVNTSAILENGKFSFLTEQEVAKQKIFSFGITANIKIGEEHE